jgi:hypothetical protein
MGELYFFDARSEAMHWERLKAHAEDAPVDVPEIEDEDDDRGQYAGLAYTKHFQDIVEADMYEDMSHITDEKTRGDITVCGTKALLREMQRDAELPDEHFELIIGEAMKQIHERRGNPDFPARGRG